MTGVRRWSWLMLWAALVVIALVIRPLLPIDETRYLSVAWEMWRRGDWLVPYLNGSAYSDKPPLLFWGMLLGWSVFGVNEWWPRVLPPLFALLGVLLLLRLARLLSPDASDADERTLPFLSTLLWVTYSTLVLFDTLLTACVLLALLGVAKAWYGRTMLGWSAYAAGVGLGALAKGPVVLVHVLPIALLAPWWTASESKASAGRASWWRWYLGLIVAIVAGAAVALIWALAAAAREGEQYRNAILWQQTAGRITHAFAHRRPWWWYLPLLPIVLFPWSLWPPLWRSLVRLRRKPNQLPVRFALAWIVPALGILSLISGKQVHYLMPLLPGLALLAAAALPEIETRGRGVVILSLVSPVIVLVAHLATRGILARQYDLRPAAELLSRTERSGRPIAYVGRYSGEYHFLGRLERPIDIIPPSRVSTWVADHPSGLVIRRGRSPADLVVVNRHH
jgi:4-amino-4-deoxy-L-arabinose transferase-like glycosyltransferase